MARDENLQRDVERFSADVVKDLEELAKLDIRVPEGAFREARDLDAMEDYLNMKAQECSDMLIQSHS